jgi:hypothetical protein
MLPHPEIARILTAQRVAAAAGTAAHSGPRFRTRLGLLLVSVGTRLAADAPLARRPQRGLYDSSSLSAAELMQ